MLRVFLLLIEAALLSSDQLNSTVECEIQDEVDPKSVRAGESLYLRCPNDFCNKRKNSSSYAWFRNISGSDELQRISTDESQRVHHHQSDLYILHLTSEDAGLYITRWYFGEGCWEFETEVVVYQSFSMDLLYDTAVEKNPTTVDCPVCEHQQGSFIWFKNFTFVPNQVSQKFRIRKSSKADEGIYTCVCTWEHHGEKHNSSGDRQLVVKGVSKRIPPTFRLPNNNSEVIADVGAELILHCLVLFGSSVCSTCFVYWEVDGIEVDEMDGYKQQNRWIEGDLESVLHIYEISESLLRSGFRCVARDEYERIFASVTLKRQESLLPVILVCVCACSVFLLFAGIVKCVALDLMLFFRDTFSHFHRKEDGKLYDAYVIYERSGCEEETERAVSAFINGPLLTELEHRRGFRLFIHGRDDLPGEDRVSLIEANIKLSRRLLIILTPESSSCEAYDLQVGLHQALVQGDTGVIVIQLGRVQDRTQLPLGLQHLLSGTPPLLWRESTSNSRFWKRVRYRMPAAPPSDRRNRLRSTASLCRSLPV